MKKVITNGQTHYGIGDAAEYLGTNALKVRRLISEGKLVTAPQRRINSRKVYVCAKSLVKYKYE